MSHSGGDGLYLADIYTAHISNVRSLWNYRQGMSIIEAFNTLVEHSEFSYTAGTAPGSGVDLENDRPTQRYASSGDLAVQYVAFEQSGLIQSPPLHPLCLHADFRM